MERLKRAVREDCLNIVQAFASIECTDFSWFCRAWKQKCFHHVYSGLLTDVELVKMTTEIFAATTELMLENNSIYMQIGCLYLLYAIYFKQPTKQYCKIAITFEDWIKLKGFLAHLKEMPDTKQTQVVFWKLVTANAFKFHICGPENKFDYNIDAIESEAVETSFKPALEVMKFDLSDVCHQDSGLLAGFEIIEDGYNEMKELMNQSNSYDNPGGILPASDITKNLKSNINQIFALLTEDKNSRMKEVSEALNKLNDSSTKRKATRNSETKPSISERRAAIKKKAFQKNTPSSSSQPELSVSLNGDFIKIVEKRKSAIQKVETIINEPLENETLAELEISDDE